MKVKCEFFKNFVFFPPVKGTVSSGFSIEEQHYAVDIAVPKNTPVKAAADGRVVLASWTSDSGFVVVGPWLSFVSVGIHLCFCIRN